MSSTQGYILPWFAYSVNVGMICVQNEKRKKPCKTGQITALKEEFYSDKDTFRVPRQSVIEVGNG